VWHGTAGGPVKYDLSCIVIMQSAFISWLTNGCQNNSFRNRRCPPRQLWGSIGHESTRILLMLNVVEYFCFIALTCSLLFYCFQCSARCTVLYSHHKLNMFIRHSGRRQIQIQIQNKKVQYQQKTDSTRQTRRERTNTNIGLHKVQKYTLFKQMTKLSSWCLSS